MNSLKNSTKTFVGWITNRDHPDVSDDDSACPEQTEIEEQSDLFINPWLGVDVIRHKVGRHPRRA